MKKLSILLAVMFALALGGKAMAAEWAVDPAHSKLGFEVKHLVITTVRGEFKDFTGTASFDPKDLSTISAEFSAKTSSIDTDNEQRDGHLRSGDFFLVDEYPEMTFKSTSAKQTAPGKAELSGDLTIRGVTKPVTFMVEGFNEPVDLGGTIKVGGKATTSINRLDYGVSWSKTLDNGSAIVSDKVDIIIDLELNQN